MVEREYEGLIQDVLDGVATPEQIARLDALVARDPAARARHQELQELFEALKRVPRVEAPPDLHRSIMRSLPASAPGVRAIAPQGKGFRVRLAYVFAAGLAAGAIGIGAVAGLWKTPGPGRDLPVVGSMMPSQAVPPGPGATYRTWTTGSIRVDAASWRVGTSRLASFKIHGGEAEVEITFDPASLSPIAFRHAASRTGRTLVEPARVVIQGVDRDEYVVEFVEPSRPSPPLAITVRAGGQAVAGSLPAPQALPRGDR